MGGLKEIHDRVTLLEPQKLLIQPPTCRMTFRMTDNCLWDCCVGRNLWELCAGTILHILCNLFACGNPEKKTDVDKSKDSLIIFINF